MALLANAAREGEDELMDLPAIVRRFELEHVSIGGPVFDVAKLDWLNARYIRERLDGESFVRRVSEWAISPERLTRLAHLAQPRIERLSDLGPLLAFLFSGRIALRPGDLASRSSTRTRLRKALSTGACGARRVAGVECGRRRVASCATVAEQLGKKPRDVARPFYVAITGSPTSIPLYDSMELLGRDVVRERLRNALDLLAREKAAV